MATAVQHTLQSDSHLRVIHLDWRNDPRWEAFISSHPDALIFHHPDWLQALEEEYGQQCICLACEDETHKLQGVLPLFFTRGLPIRLGRHAIGARLSSLPRTPVAGPLVLSHAATEALIHEAVAVTNSQAGAQLEIKAQAGDLPFASLTRMNWRATYVEELPTIAEGQAWDEFAERVRLPRNCGSCQGCRRLRFGNAKQQHRVNWAVKKAMKLGLAVREADSEKDLAGWYQLYLETMRHNAVPPRSYRFFLSLWSSMRPAGRMRLLLAEQEADSSRRMICGSIVLKYGQTAFYAFTGCSPKDFCLHPHDLIQLESIRDACKGGFRWYDFGEVTEDHGSLAQFKTKWGSQPKELYRFYYPAPAEKVSAESGRLASTLRKAWRHLPVKATQVLGDWIYQYL